MFDDGERRICCAGPGVAIIHRSNNTVINTEELLDSQDS